MTILRKQIFVFDDMYGIQSLEIPQGQKIITAKIVNFQKYERYSQPFYKIEVAIVTTEEKKK